jgi:hypothetical protein
VGVGDGHLLNADPPGELRGLNPSRFRELAEGRYEELRHVEGDVVYADGCVWC